MAKKNTYYLAIGYKTAKGGCKQISIDLNGRQYKEAKNNLTQPLHPLKRLQHTTILHLYEIITRRTGRRLS